jgi:Leucine-rich repeat (LRR) protein
MLELNEIAFNDCNLTGEIPASLGNLGGTPFYFLYLQNNNLSGCIPSSLQSLCPNVTTFGNISGNPLIATQSWTNFCNNQEGMCQACGTHPDYAPLMALYNSTGGPNWTNNTGWVDGAAGTNCDPCNGWHGVTCDSARVSTVHLSNNNLKGVLPIDFEELTKLKSLVLDNNIISGTIPLNLGQLSNLENLALYDLNLHGEIPATFLNLQKLKYLSLNGNQLSGEIPDYLGSLSNLENIYLFNNLFKGSIPSSLGDLTKVKNLWLQNNNLNGCLPENLSNLCPIANLVFLENNPLLLTQSWTNFCNNQEGMCEPTNVKEEQSSIPFSLFPNPAYDMIYISQSDKISQLEVMSINGNLILRNHS